MIQQCHIYLFKIIQITTHICTTLVITALFTITKMCKGPKYTFSHEWIQKYDKIEHHSALRYKEILQ